MRAARDRFALRIRLTAAAWAGLGVVLAIGILELIRYQIPTVSGWLVVGLALVVLAIASVGAVLHSRRSIPDLLWVARQADRHFALDERLGTAVEFGYRYPGGSPANPVLFAQTRDAERHASRVQPERLVQLKVPRPAWFLAIALLGVVAFEFAPRSGMLDAGERGSVSLVGAPESAETVLEAAAFLEDQAEELRDPEVMEVAVAMRELGEAMADEELTEEEFEAELAEILEDAERALQANGRSTASRASNPPRDRTAATNEDPMMGEDFGEEGTASEGQSALESLLSRLNESQREALMEELAQAEAEAEPGLQGPGDSDPRDSRSGRSSQPGNGEIQFQPMLQDQISEMFASDDMVSSVPGSGAGSGSAPFEGPGESDLPLLEQMGRRELELAVEQGNANRPVGAELPPATELSAVADQLSGIRTWRAGNVEALPPDHLSISYWTVASRYFVSMTQQPEAAVEP